MWNLVLFFTVTYVYLLYTFKHMILELFLFSSFKTWTQFVMLLWGITQVDIFLFFFATVLLRNRACKLSNPTRSQREDCFYIYEQRRKKVQVWCSSSLSHQAKCSDRVEQSTVGFLPPRLLFFINFFFRCPTNRNSEMQVSLLFPHMLCRHSTDGFK